MFKRQKVRQIGTANSSALLWNKFVLFIYMYLQNGKTNMIGGVGKKTLFNITFWVAPHRAIFALFHFSGCKALFLIDSAPQV